MNGREGVDRWVELEEMSQMEEEPNPYVAVQLDRLEAFTALRQAQEKLEDHFLEELVYTARYPGLGTPPEEGSDKGASWAAIGKALGVTADAARQRYGKRMKQLYVERLRDLVAHWHGTPDEEIRALLAQAEQGDE